MISVDGMPVTKAGDDSNSLFYAGLMVAVGDSRPIKGIKKCQDEQGRLWKSPNRIGRDKQNGFDYDQALGFILYFQETQDKEMGNKWIKYLESEGHLFPMLEATDERYAVTPTLWWLASYAGLKVPFFWKSTRFLCKKFLKSEIQNAKTASDRHRAAVALLIIAKYEKKLTNDLGFELWKTSPQNAFFAYLAGFSQSAADLAHRIEAIHNCRPGDGSRWCWRHEDRDEAWRDAMGWDFEFIERLVQLAL